MTTSRGFALPRTIARALALVALVAQPLTPTVRAQQVMCLPAPAPPFGIDRPEFQSYFQSLGSEPLGFPISRTFRLDGFTVQFFQRAVLQLQPGGVARLNMLDSNVIPLTHANASVFPPPDPEVIEQAPRLEDPAYVSKVGTFIQTVVPDTWNGQPVGFFSLFQTTVPVPPGTDPTFANLEIWGLPTSRPAFDPGNQSFVYQRFQRGIMHFVAGQTPHGILVGDYLKMVITGRDLPADLAADMQGSRYFRQYAPNQPGWVARPAVLPDTDLTEAFEPTPACQSGPSPIPPAPGPSPVPPGPAPGPVPPGPAPGPVPPGPVPPPIPTTATLKGTVRTPKGDPLDGATVMVNLTAFQTTSKSDGSYSLSDLPRAAYDVVALKGDAASATVPVDMSGGDQSRDLTVPPADPGDGQKSVFVGRVAGARGADIVVWRLGGSGVASVDADGLFYLVDVFSGSKKSPTKVTLVARQGNQWGYAAADFDKDPTQSVTVQLSHTGKPPDPPRVLKAYPAKTNVDDTLTVPAGGAVFNAVWKTQQPNPVTFSGNPPQDSTQDLPCLGPRADCGSGFITTLVTRLPAGSVRVQAANPNWTQAHILPTPP